MPAATAASASRCDHRKRASSPSSPPKSSRPIFGIAEARSQTAFAASYRAIAADCLWTCDSSCEKPEDETTIPRKARHNALRLDDMERLLRVLTNRRFESLLRTPFDVLPDVVDRLLDRPKFDRADVTIVRDGLGSSRAVHCDETRAVARPTGCIVVFEPEEAQALD